MPAVRVTAQENKPAAPAVSEEIELKFTLPVAALQLLAKSGLSGMDATKPKSAPLTSRYYDTPDRLLARQGVALRVRNKGDKWLQHLKWRGSDDDFIGGSKRTEWEWPVAGPEPQPHCIDLAIRHDLNLPANWHRQLAPVFETAVQRHSQNIRVDQSLIELACDIGVLRAGDAERTIAEVELEFKNGNPAQLYRVARRLVAETGARLAGGSKAEQGYRLADGCPPASRKSTAAKLLIDDTGHTALARQAGKTLADLLINQEVVIAGSGPEGVHQMRVALRRLDAVMRPLRHLFDSPQSVTLMDELKWLRQTLGPLRNWDVFIGETLPALQRAKSGKFDWCCAVSLQEAAQTNRIEAQNAVSAALNDHRYAALLLNLTLLAVGDLPLAADKSPMQQRFQGLASRWLIEQLTAMDYRGRHLYRLSPHHQHRFRLRIKKTRYVAETIAVLTPNSPLKPVARHMAKLQNRLGYLNDRFTAVELLEALKNHHSIEHNDTALKGIAKQQKRWLKQLKTKCPDISQRWQQITKASDQWIANP